MIPKIMAPRRDGRSSFKQLEQYLTVERKPGSKEETARGPVLLSANLFSLESAAKEMRAAARDNRLVDAPLMHFQVAWPPGERPTETQWQGCAERMIAALGFGEHQYLIAAHDDKEHFHAHVMLNRVHPETAKAHNPRLSQLTLHRVARDLEHQFGWTESAGLYRWDRERGEPVRNTKAELEVIRDKREQATGKVPQQMARQDHFRDQPSLKAFAAMEPAAALRRLLAGDANWQRVHEALSLHGLTIHKAEKGGYTVGVEGSSVRVKASDVFRFAFSGKDARGRTEAKLGTFEPAREQQSLKLRSEPVGVARIDVRQITPGERGQRAGVQLVVRSAAAANTEPRKSGGPAAQMSAERRRAWLDREAEMTRLRRVQQVETRAGERLELKREFRVLRSEEKAALHQHVATGAARRYELKAGFKREKETIRGLTAPWQLKQAMRSVLAAEDLLARQKLSVELTEERSHIPKTTYQQWVEQQTGKGDARAASQMRGWHYQDSRNLRRGEDRTDKKGGRLGSARTTASDRHARLGWEVTCNDHLRLLKGQAAFRETLVGVHWKTNNTTGEITYNVKGVDALVDGGKHIAVLIPDRNVTRVALQLAIHKYGGRINAKGTAEWEAQLINAAVQDKVRVVFTDKELQRRFIAAWKEARRPVQPAEADLSLAETQFKRLEAEYIARYGHGVEPVRLDQLLATRMARSGISEDQIAEVLRRHSGDQARRGTPAHAGYCERTAAVAIGQTRQQAFSIAKGSDLDKGKERG